MSFDSRNDYTSEIDKNIKHCSDKSTASLSAYQVEQEEPSKFQGTLGPENTEEKGYYPAMYVLHEEISETLAYLIALYKGLYHKT